MSDEPVADAPENGPFYIGSTPVKCGHCDEIITVTNGQLDLPHHCTRRRKFRDDIESK